VLRVVPVPGKRICESPRSFGLKPGAVVGRLSRSLRGRLARAAGLLFRLPLYQFTESRPAGTTFRSPAGTTCPTVPRRVAGSASAPTGLSAGCHWRGLWPASVFPQNRGRCPRSETLPIGCIACRSTAGSKPPLAAPMPRRLLGGSFPPLVKTDPHHQQGPFFSSPAEIFSPSRGLWSTFCGSTTL